MSKTTNKYTIVGYVTEAYILDNIEAESKEAALQSLMQDKDSVVVTDEDFNEMVKNGKKLSHRQCEIDAGILDEDTNMINFKVN